VLNGKAGKILSLFVSNATTMNQENMVSITLDKNGIVSDKFYNKNINRSVLITSCSSYSLVRDKKIDINYGDLGENLLVDFNPYKLSIGQQLKVGDAILEISQHCTLCNSLSRINKNIPKILKNDRGIFAQVIKSGTISQDDVVTYLNTIIETKL